MNVQHGVRCDAQVSAGKIHPTGLNCTAKVVPRRGSQCTDTDGTETEGGSDVITARVRIRQIACEELTAFSVGSMQRSTAEHCTDASIR
jgi:hypothetical protein